MKKILLSFLIVFFCVISYAQDSITVYQGTNVQKFLLSEIDSITHNANNTVNIYHNNQKYGFSVMKVDSVSFMERKPAIIDNNPFTIIANIDDPEIIMFQADENNLIHFYGTKNEEGLPLSINTIVIDNEKEGNAKISIDEKMRPLQVYTPVGIIYDFNWNDDFSGVITAYDTSTGTTIKVAFDRTLVDGITTNAPNIKHNLSRKRLGVLQMNATPLISTSGKYNAPIRKSAENGNQECLVTFMKCDDYYDPNDIYLAIFNKNGWVANLHNYNKTSTGKYVFRIPSDAYPSIDTAKWAEWINNILGAMGNISVFLTASGGDYYVCGAIATGLTLLSEGAFAACAAQFTAGCVAFNRIITTATLINTGGTDAGASISGNLIEYLKNANILKRVYTGNIRIGPIVDGLGGHYPDVIMTPEQNSVTIPIVTEDTPSVRHFSCNPSEPAAGQSYDATIILHCMPSGTSVTMSVVGTDNYKDSKTTTLSSPNSTVTLHVPGAAQGVQDRIEVRVNDANGELISYHTVSLYFH